MRDLFRETVFGRAVHFISGGKLFRSSDEAAPVEGDVADDEKGVDSNLVDWTENDSEVSSYTFGGYPPADD